MTEETELEVCPLCGNEVKTLTWLDDEECCYDCRDKEYEKRELCDPEVPFCVKEIVEQRFGLQWHKLRDDESGCYMMGGDRTWISPSLICSLIREALEATGGLDES